MYQILIFELLIIIHHCLYGNLLQLLLSHLPRGASFFRHGLLIGGKVL